MTSNRAWPNSLALSDRIHPTLIYSLIGALSLLPSAARAGAPPRQVNPPLPPIPLNGLYAPTQGNEPSICPQDLKVQTLPSQQLVRIRVAYTGDCGYIGPYWYRCLMLTAEETGSAPQWLCGEDAIWFRFFNETKYEWKNLAYHFEAIFEPSL